MTQHITQETVKNLWQRVCTDHEDSDIAAQELCNAAIQHYIDQRAKELPILPEAVELNPASNSVLGFKAEHLQAYGAACAAHAREVALGEAKQAAEECDVVEAKGNTYYAQLGDASATQRGIVAAIEALKKAGK